MAGCAKRCGDAVSDKARICWNIEPVFARLPHNQDTALVVAIKEGKTNIYLERGENMEPWFCDKLQADSRTMTYFCGPGKN